MGGNCTKSKNNAEMLESISSPPIKNTENLLNVPFLSFLALPSTLENYRASIIGELFSSMLNCSAKS